MIISHTRHYIFFAIPKTGTHAIRRALRPTMDQADQEQVVLFGKRELPYPEIAAIQHGHVSAQQIRPAIGEELFRSYFKFAFVRNPFDRFVSYCAFASSYNGGFQASPRPFMRAMLAQSRPFEHILLHPQSEFVTDADGQLAVDFIGRAERLQDDYDRVCDAIGLPRSALARVNETGHRDYREYYDDELIEQVSEVYRSDLQLFGYSFDGEAGYADRQHAEDMAAPRI